MLLQNTPHNLLVETLEAGSFLRRLPTLELMTRVWEAAKKTLGYRGFTEWENSKLGEVQKLGKDEV